jgi:hypothetical protein
VAKEDRVITIADNWKRPLIIAVACTTVMAAALGLWLLERYLRKAWSVPMGPLVLEDVPGWVDRSTPLCDKIRAAAGGDYFPLQEHVAQALASRLDGLAWMADVQVEITPSDVRVRAYWRRPVALVDMGSVRFYVDQDLVVLDYVDLPHLGLKRVTGVRWPHAPQLSEVMDANDLKEAINVLSLIESMDVRATPAKPLLSEIEGIDVSNYQGRRGEKGPHVVLSAKDGTQVVWGAEIGTWGRHMEATDEQKLARLFSFYKEAEGQPTLMGRVKYIDLRAPLREVTTPIDQYPATGR